MFKKELTADRVQSIIEKIDSALEKKQAENLSSSIQTGDVVSDIMKTWTD